MNLKVLFIGDISARPGREIVGQVLPEIRKKERIDLVIANCENAAGGRGVTREKLNELQSYGIDFFTTGEHVWDIKKFQEDLHDLNLPIVRPVNYEASTFLPGRGWEIIDLGEKGRVIIIAMLGEIFMRDFVRSPFWYFDELYKEIEKKVGKEELLNIPIIIDFHAETTSEKISFAWYVKSKVAAIIGTHTHVPTCDVRILPRNGRDGCAFVTDVGMCGILNASLWVDFDTIIHNFKFPYKKSFKVAKEGLREFNSVVIEFEENFAKKIYRIDKQVDQ